MKKRMTGFNHPAFGQIRVIQEDGKYLFYASDVAKALGYKRPADAVTAHCKGSVIYRLLTAGGEQAVKLIPEGDVYRLIVHSKLPAGLKQTTLMPLLSRATAPTSALPRKSWKYPNGCSAVFCKKKNICTAPLLEI